MLYKFRFILYVILLVSFVQQSVWAQTEPANDPEFPAIKVAMSDDQSVIIERILYEGLKRSGYQMVAKATGMRTAVADVNYGDAVILPVQTDGWERMYPNLIKVPVAIDNVEFSVYTRSDASYQFNEWSDMSGLRLGYRWQNEYIANNIWRAGADRLITVNEISELWVSLNSGGSDAVILPRMSHYEHRFPQGIKRAGVVERQPVYTYVNSMHSFLVPLLEKAYREMFADGTIALIHNSRDINNNKPIILHINSFTAQNEWERTQMESIRNNIELDITAAGYNASEYYNFYLDSNEFNSRAGFNSIVSDMIRTRFEARNPGLVIASGNEALDFVMNNYYLLFPNIPVLFFDVQGLDSSVLYGLDEFITGVSQTVSFNETVSEMLRLFPKTRQIYILNDNLLFRSIKIREEIKRSIDYGNQITRDLPIEFIFSESKSFAEILEDIKSFESDTLVLIGSYLSDNSGVFYSEIDVQNLVSDASVNPVFSLIASYIGHGTLGGLVSATGAQSSIIASMAVDIIKGKSPSQIPIIYDSASLNQWKFDYETVKKYNINLKNLPAGYIIINRPLPIWESNRREFNLMLTVASLVVLIIFGLMMFLRVLVKKQADESMHMLLDALPLGSLLFRKNFEVVDCNKAALNLYGFKDKQEYAEKFFKYCSPEYQPDGQSSDKKAKFIINKVFDEGYCKFEWLHRHMNGEPMPAEVTLIRIKHNREGDLIAGYTRDLKEYKAYIAEIEKINEDLRQARDAAENASKIKSTFLANMSHEIRTPMNSIIGFAELALHNDSLIKIKEYLGNISRSAEWLLLIINDILDISKIESGKITLEHIPFDLHEVLAHCQMTIMQKIEEKGIAFYCYAEPSINKKLMGDPIRLCQVIINLLSNAVKFTDAGTVKFMASPVSESGKNITIHFEVKDTGIGMTPEQIAMILEPFMQADETVTRRFGGTGLGLQITKNIVELMGGNLTVDSVPGAGSKFSFDITFDISDEDAGAVSSENLHYVLEKPNFCGEVLICDDNNMNQKVICDHLARVGLKTIIANNGREGIDLAAERMQSGKKQFDLIFMDIYMPGMDGFEAASKIAALGVKTPIVALTANIMSNNMELYTKNGMRDCLGKPFTSQELWKCLIKFIPVVYYSAVDKIRDDRENEKLLKQAQINFARNNQTTYSQITSAAEIGSFELARRLAHTLKSNAGQIGAVRLQAAAAQLENMFAEGKAPLNKAEMKILEIEIKSVLDDLAPLLAEFDAARAEKSVQTRFTDAKKILEILDKLEPFLKNKNPECEDLLDDILAIPGAEELAHQIEKFNFKQAAEELIKLKKEWE